MKQRNVCFNLLLPVWIVEECTLSVIFFPKPFTEREFPTVTVSPSGLSLEEVRQGAIHFVSSETLSEHPPM